jgi:hypothetical protein
MFKLSLRRGVVVLLVGLHAAALAHLWRQLPPRTAGHYWSSVPGNLDRDWGALTNAQVYLLVAWSLLAARRRIAVAAGLAIAGTAAWIVPVCNAQDLTAQEWTWMVLARYLPMALTALVLAIARRRGWRLEVPASALPAARERLQYSVRAMLLAVTTAAALLALSTAPIFWIQETGTISIGPTEPGCLQIGVVQIVWSSIQQPGLALTASFALLTPVACLSAHRLLLCPLPFRTFLAAIVIQAVIIAAMYAAGWRQCWGDRRWKSLVDWFLVGPHVWPMEIWTALLIAGSLLVVRLAGYRLVRRERAAEGAAV